MAIDEMFHAETYETLYSNLPAEFTEFPGRDGNAAFLFTAASEMLECVILHRASEESFARVTANATKMHRFGHIAADL